jgi:hypothetical protein
MLQTRCSSSVEKGYGGRTSPLNYTIFSFHDLVNRSKGRTVIKVGYAIFSGAHAAVFLLAGDLEGPDVQGQRPFAGPKE